MPNCTCQKCGRTKDEGQFYTYRDGRKTELCKDCLTMHIDPYNSETFVWLLEKMDVPYIPSEWSTLCDKAFAKDPGKVRGSAIFGKYLSKMKLQQWKKYRWADTEELQRQQQEKIQQSQDQLAVQTEYLKEQHAAGLISDAEYKTLATAAAQKEEYYERAAIAAGSGNAQRAGENAFDENAFFDPSQLPDPSDELDQEDKIYLAMKWGTMYRPQEWLSLERMYREMEVSFDIQDADSRSTLILLCKTNLKANQAIDQGDFEGYQKLAKVADNQRKTAKFTAAQNKSAEKEEFDSVGEIVLLCEREGGFIPKMEINIPRDIVDATLKDNELYTHRLVTEDLGLGQQIEDAIKKFQIQKEIIDNEAKKAAAKVGEDDFALEDEELMEMYDEIDAQKDADAALEQGGDEY